MADVFISRVINGTEHVFKLTDSELFNAFLEQERRFDAEDVKLWADDDIPGVMFNELVKEYRRSINNCEDYHMHLEAAFDSVDGAFEYYCED